MKPGARPAGWTKLVAILGFIGACTMTSAAADRRAAAAAAPDRRETVPAEREEGEAAAPDDEGEGGDLADNATARQAQAKYEASVDLARRDYEKKVALLRETYERKVTTARTALVAALRKAEREEAKKGKAAVARAIKAAIAEAEAEGEPAWPDVLPEASSPAAADAAEAAGAAGTKFSETFSLDDEAATRKFWNLPGDNWQIRDGKLRLPDVGQISTKHSFRGDMEFKMETLDGNGELYIAGEKVCEWKGGGRQVVKIVRKGNVIKVNLNGRVESINVKEAAAKVAHPVVFKYGTLRPDIWPDTWITGIKITAAEAEIEDELPE